VRVDGFGGRSVDRHRLSGLGSGERRGQRTGDGQPRANLAADGVEDQRREPRAAPGSGFAGTAPGSRSGAGAQPHAGTDAGPRASACPESTASARSEPDADANAGTSSGASTGPESASAAGAEQVFVLNHALESLRAK
jgi:hypothetical protein